MAIPIVFDSTIEPGLETGKHYGGVKEHVKNARISAGEPPGHLHVLVLDNSS